MRDWERRLIIESDESFWYRWRWLTWFLIVSCVYLACTLLYDPDPLVPTTSTLTSFLDE